MPKILAALALTLFAATLPEMFKQAKDEYAAGNYKQSLADFDALDKESRKPGFEADRAKLAPVILFYRGANLAALGRKDEARDTFIAYLSYMPNASIASPPFPKPVVEVFDLARKDVEGKNNSLLAMYAQFKPAPGWALAADQAWADSPVRYLLTPEQKKQYAALTTPDERVAFVDKFWAAYDPTPGTPQNEFRTEFERRVAFADANFSTPKVLGGATDRGAIFTFLGPPTFAGVGGMSANDDAMGALRSSGNSDIAKGVRGSNSTNLGAFATAPGDENDPNHWRTKRESWTYRRDRLPPQVPMNEVRFDFLTQEGYGTGVLQKDPAPMQTLGYAVDVAKKEKKLN
jgi:GWxTD domain-containing protein